MKAHSIVVLLYSIAVLHFLNIHTEPEWYLLLLPTLAYAVFNIVKSMKPVTKEIYIKSMVILAMLAMLTACSNSKKAGKKPELARAKTIKTNTLVLVFMSNEERSMYNNRDTIQLIRVTQANEWSKNQAPFKVFHSIERRDTTYRKGGLIIEEVVAHFN